MKIIQKHKSMSYGRSSKFSISRLSKEPYVYKYRYIYIFYIYMYTYIIYISYIQV